MEMIWHQTVGQNGHGDFFATPGDEIFECPEIRISMENPRLSIPAIDRVVTYLSCSHSASSGHGNILPPPSNMWTQIGRKKEQGRKPGAGGSADGRIVPPNSLISPRPDGKPVRLLPAKEACPHLA
jgi:hypothetical protein